MILLALLILGILFACIVACFVDIVECCRQANHEARLDRLWGDE